MGRSADTLPKALRTLRLASVELVLGTNILETKAIGEAIGETVTFVHSSIRCRARRKKK